MPLNTAFELTLGTAGKLLRKALKLHGASARTTDALALSDVVRTAGLRGLFDTATVERWLKYRAHRHTSAHDGGAGFANETLKLWPAYPNDTRARAAALQNVFGANQP